jgi:ADP-heptose:LPS heptosyltransferase
VAILKGGGLGDFLVSTPAIRALRKAVPSAEITLLTTPNLEALARRYEAFDRVLVVPAYPGVRSGPADEAERTAFFDQMQAESFALALQWHGGGANSNPFVRRLGAGTTAGFKSDDAPPLDYWLPYDQRRHEVLRYLDLVTLLGAQPDGFELDLPVVPEDYAELERLADVVDLSALRAGRYLGVHASAGGPSRRWAPERFAAVVDALLDEHDLAGCLVTAGAGQEDDSARVVSAARHRDRVTDLGGKTTLGSLVALISQVRLYITNDSGPAHMATALGTPSVIVFGAANPAVWGPLEQAWHRVVANWATPCRWMERDGCAERSDLECLVTVPVEPVLAQARQLLDLLDRVPATAERQEPLARRSHRRTGASPHQQPLVPAGRS